MHVLDSNSSKVPSQATLFRVWLPSSLQTFEEQFSQLDQFEIESEHDLNFHIPWPWMHSSLWLNGWIFFPQGKQHGDQSDSWHSWSDPKEPSAKNKQSTKPFAKYIFDETDGKTCDLDIDHQHLWFTDTPVFWTGWQVEIWTSSGKKQVFDLKFLLKIVFFHKWIYSFSYTFKSESLSHTQ